VTEALAAPRRRVRDPFTLGVASGDPLPRGVVLWTRLAADPLAPDGLGGMPRRVVPVQWQLAHDERFRRVVRTGQQLARPESAHSVHAEVDGLAPGREYFYRFRTADGHLSPTGRTVTAPAPTSRTAFTMAFASCSQYEHGYFTAYRHLADEEPDVILHLGDYIYEYKANDYTIAQGNVRDHAGPETETLANYRQRHAQYKTDLDLQLAHAAAPWLVVWDDHEVDNNWADEVPEKPEIPQPNFLDRRAAAFRAYYENMPLRRSSVPQGIDLQLYRRVRWGRMATFHMLDTRQYRSDQACGDGARTGCAERLDPARSITGAEQERWLLDGLRRSTSTWDVIGQQVFFAQRDFTAGPVQTFSMDGWDGYVASRDRLLRGIADTDVTNPVVLTGDVHRHYANELKANFDDASSPTVGVELVTTSITSNGDGSDRTPATDVQLAENPHIKFANTQRGYVRTTFTSRQLRADFRVLPYVTQPGAPVSTRASFVVEEGEPGLHPA
jgi:alkaline phosphatase D